MKIGDNLFGVGDGGDDVIKSGDGVISILEIILMVMVMVEMML